MGLAARLGELRRKKSQSLQEVADAVGVSKAHIWDLEKGRADNPSMGLVERLADHFQVSIGFLVNEDRESPEQDDDLVRLFRQASKLDPRERRILDAMIQSMLQQRRPPDEST